MPRRPKIIIRVVDMGLFFLTGKMVLNTGTQVGNVARIAVPGYIVVQVAFSLNLLS